jgi:hypothetical protein
MRALSVVCAVVASAIMASACQDSRPLAPSESAVGARAHTFTVLQVTPISGPDTVGSLDTVTYSVTASQGVPPYTYAWSNDGFGIVGPTNESSAMADFPCLYTNGFEVMTAVVTDAGNYKVTVQKTIHWVKHTEPC